MDAIPPPTLVMDWLAAVADPEVQLNMVVVNIDKELVNSVACGLVL